MREISLSEGAKTFIRDAAPSVTILSGDITDLPLECLVNSTRPKAKRRGIRKDFADKAGEELEREWESIGGVEVGQAKITNGYGLKAKYVIHTMGPAYNGLHSDAPKLANCYWNSLCLAMAKGIHEIAFPTISSGVYGYPIEQSSTIAIATVSEWLTLNKGYGMKVVFCCYPSGDRLTERYYRTVYQLAGAEIK